MPINLHNILLNFFPISFTSWQGGSLMNNSFSYASLVKLADMKYRVMKTCLKSIYKSTFMVNRKSLFPSKIFIASWNAGVWFIAWTLENGSSYITQFGFFCYTIIQNFLLLIVQIRTKCPHDDKLTPFEEIFSTSQDNHAVI